MGSKKRLQSLDILRGFMILYVIFLHAIIQRVFSSEKGDFKTTVSSVPLIFAILVSPIILMSIWGPIFTFIGGIANGYNIGGIMQESKSELGRRTKIRFANNLMLFLIAKLDLLLFSGRTSDHISTTYSLLTGSLENGQWTTLEFLHFFTNNTLESMAIAGMLLSLLLYGLAKWKGGNHDKIAKKLVILGIVVLLVAEFFRVFLSDQDVFVIKQTLWESGSFLNYSLFIRLYASRFAIFPVFAFSLFGAALGILIAGGVSFQKFARWTFGLGSGLIGIFVASFIHGFDMIGTYADELLPMQMQCLNLGLMMILFGGLYYRFDVRPQLATKSKIRMFFRKYSNLSMTIYILEGFVAQIWYLVFLILHRGPFSNNLPLIIVYLATVLATWQIIVNFWTKIGNRGSFEWLMLKGRIIILHLTRKKLWKKHRNYSPQVLKRELIVNY
jgi:hypothetical protein